MARRFLSGEALTVFDTIATYLGKKKRYLYINSTKLYYSHLSHSCLALKKRYMRRHMRTPLEMTTRTFAAQVAKLSAYLIVFPAFDVNQNLYNTEIIDILRMVSQTPGPKLWSYWVLTL
jgi:hypothetical protein